MATHIRDEGDAIVDALTEALQIGQALGIETVLSHHKLVGKANHGRSVETLAMIEAAGRKQSVCLDGYPYNASSTMLLPARIAQSDDVRVTWSKADPRAAGLSLFAHRALLPACQGGGHRRSDRGRRAADQCPGHHHDALRLATASDADLPAHRAGAGHRAYAHR
ncbi:hypothetical protein [Cupriavidus sp. IK-TO18]|uniref:hypothetical protein n=1 Tax=Cupriavidus sp. IK-TO18 TaxID=2782182 RepID=UPI00189B9A7C|nr:hypothetical protein [Cupriavidus sp. IK-TO18]MBF6991983.1 hypothetical protein [Cupriavidus sp. IK-TO18]